MTDTRRQALTGYLHVSLRHYAPITGWECIAAFMGTDRPRNLRDPRLR